MEFVFVSGNLALDLAGTLKWRGDRPEEQLGSPQDLARWAVQAGILTEEPVLTASDLGCVKDLREAVYRLAVGSLRHATWPPGDIDLLNGHASGAPPHIALLPGTARATRTGTGEAIGWATARAAIDLLGTTAPPIRECDRDRCTRLFVDRSRTGNRRWCGMAECGNRVKAAQYRVRKKSHAGG